jgi:hypothetical protein
VAGERAPPYVRAQRVPDAPPLLLAARGRRDAWCSSDDA